MPEGRGIRRAEIDEREAAQDQHERAATARPRCTYQTCQAGRRRSLQRAARGARRELRALEKEPRLGRAERAGDDRSDCRSEHANQGRPDPNIEDLEGRAGRALTNAPGATARGLGRAELASLL